MRTDRILNPIILDNPLRHLIDSKDKVIKRFIDLVKDNFTVVDLGCGPGYFTIELAKIFKNGIIYAIDPDKKSIKILEEKIKENDIKNVIIYNSRAQNLDFIKDNSIDFIFSNLVLCCTIDHEGYIKEMNRILKNNGLAYISVSKNFLLRDKMNVSKDEWIEILKNYIIIKYGEDFLSRWAIIKKK